jgi:hypothetical protein
MGLPGLRGSRCRQVGEGAGVAESSERELACRRSGEEVLDRM